MRNRPGIVLAWLVVAFAFLAACGDGGGDAASTTTAPGEESTTSAPSTTVPPTSVPSTSTTTTGEPVESASIVVESPLPGETVTSPLTVTGSSATFEGNVLISLTDSTGAVVYDSFFTSSGANGVWGPFEETIEFDAAPGPGTLTLWESDVASDDPGARRNVVEIPVSIG